ncbi:MAG: hypothetical protein LAO30_22005 [Acidobacteriia bacterium]|nr:hypothetical protein [Terriglobia bacterium]
MEMLVVLMIVGSGLFAAANMVYSNLALVERDSDEVVAINLGREGIELAKQTRDSNWLVGNPFNQGLQTTSTKDYTAVPAWSGVAGSLPAFNFTPNAIASTGTSVVKTASGFYANAIGVVSGTSTGFSRLLTFYPICNDYTTTTGSGVACSDSGKIQIGVRTEAWIQWKRKGVTKTRKMYGDVYDWK